MGQRFYQKIIFDIIKKLLKERKKLPKIDGNSSQMEWQDKNVRTKRAVNVMSSSMIESVRTINHFLMKAKLRTT